MLTKKKTTWKLSGFQEISGQELSSKKCQLFKVKPKRGPTSNALVKSNSTFGEKVSHILKPRALSKDMEVGGRAPKREQRIYFLFRYWGSSKFLP